MSYRDGQSLFSHQKASRGMITNSLYTFFSSQTTALLKFTYSMRFGIHNLFYMLSQRAM